MELACPRCSRLLPEVQTLKYRFCPHCGAEIAADPQKLDDACATIPPDLTSRQPGRTTESSMKDTGKKPAFTGRFNDQTSEPQPITMRPRPKLKPPETPPPSSFFRTPGKPIKPSPQRIPEQTSAKNRNKIIIAVLILLAVVILIIGGLFTF